MKFWPGRGYLSNSPTSPKQMPVICPITNGGDFARRIGLAVPVTGIKTTGVVRCDQPRVLDLAARKARKMDTLPTPIMDEVLARLAPIFE